jgi:hypothetical protein
MEPQGMKFLILIASTVFSISVFARVAPTVDALQFSTLGQAVAAAKGRTLVISIPTSLANRLTVPRDTALEFVGGGRIVKTAKASITVTIEGAMAGPDQARFVGFAPGEVKLSHSPVAKPVWWGARGDRVADDTSAVQAALKSGVSHVHLSAGNYRLTQTLDATDFAGYRLTGEGFSATTLVGETGGVVIDATGSSGFVMRDFGIEAGGETPSSVGILYARSKAFPFVEFSSLDNVRIYLPPVAKGPGNWGSIAVYNNAAELWSAHDTVLIAGLPIAFTRTNIFNLQSSYTTWDTQYQSMSGCTLSGNSSLLSLGGPALLLQETSTMEFDNTYINRWQGAFPYAIQNLGMAVQLKYFGNVEGFSRFLLTDGTVTNADLRANIPQHGPLLFLDGSHGTHPGFTGGTLQLFPPPWGPQDPSRPLVASRGVVEGFSNETIYLYSKQSVSLSAAHCQGLTFISTDASPTVKLTSTSATPCSYQVQSPAGIDFYGPVHFHP